MQASRIKSAILIEKRYIVLITVWLRPADYLFCNYWNFSLF